MYQEVEKELPCDGRGYRQRKVLLKTRAIPRAPGLQSVSVRPVGVREEPVLEDLVRPRKRLGAQMLQVGTRAEWIQ